VTCFDHGAGVIGREDGLRGDVPLKVVLECGAGRSRSNEGNAAQNH
jgi:hypothetical protein